MSTVIALREVLWHALLLMAKLLQMTDTVDRTTLHSDITLSHAVWRLCMFCICCMFRVSPYLKIDLHENGLHEGNGLGINMPRMQPPGAAWVGLYTVHGQARVPFSSTSISDAIGHTCHYDRLCSCLC